jgi:hypothetical protein
LKPWRQFSCKLFREPGVKYLVVRSKGYSTWTNDRDDLPFLDSVEEIVPENFIEFT